MNRLVIPILGALALLTIVEGCASAPTPTVPPAPPPTIAPNQPTTIPTAPTAIGEPLYVAIVWHNHQPFYFRDPTTGVYEKPWVRMHAVKDYLRMPALVEKYPNVHVTFNLTPSLIEQLDAFVAGAKDKYWVLAEKPADQLTSADKRFILQRFFDANPTNIIGIFPRYKELYDARGKSFDDAFKNFSSADWRDLQVWFNLAWIDPAYQAQEPLKSLIAKGRDFSEDDKKTVFDVTRTIISAVIPE